MVGRRQPNLAAWLIVRAPRRCCSCMQPSQLPHEHSCQLWSRAAGVCLLSAMRYMSHAGVPLVSILL